MKNRGKNKEAEITNKGIKRRYFLLLAMLALVGMGAAVGMSGINKVLAASTNEGQRVTSQIGQPFDNVQDNYVFEMSYDYLKQYAAAEGIDGMSDEGLRNLGTITAEIFREYDIYDLENSEELRAEAAKRIVERWLEMYGSEQTAGSSEMLLRFVENMLESVVYRYIPVIREKGLAENIGQIQEIYRSDEIWKEKIEERIGALADGATALYGSLNVLESKESQAEQAVWTIQENIGLLSKSLQELLENSRLEQNEELQHLREQFLTEFEQLRESMDSKDSSLWIALSKAGSGLESLWAEAAKEALAREQAAAEEASERERAIERAITREASAREGAIEKAIAKETLERKEAIGSAAAEEASERERAIEQAIAEEALEREGSIEQAIAEEASERERAVEQAIAQEALERKRAIKSAAAEEASERERAVEQAIAEEAIEREGSIEQAIAQEALEREGSIEQAIAQEALEREGSIEQAIAQETLARESALSRMAAAGGILSERVDSLKREMGENIASVKDSISEEISNVQKDFGQKMSGVSERLHEITEAGFGELSGRMEQILREHSEDIRNTKEELDGEIVRIKTKAEEEIGELEKRIETLGKELEGNKLLVKTELEGEIAELGGKIDIFQKELEEKISRAKAELSENVQENVQQVKEEYAAFEADLNGTVAELSSTVAGISGTMAGINSTVEGMSGTVAGISGTVEGLSGNLAAVSAEIDGVKNSASNITEQISKMENRLTANENAVAVLEANTKESGNIYELPNGMLMQWGEFTVSDTEPYPFIQQNVVLEHAFSGTEYSVVFTPYGGSGFYLTAGVISKNSDSFLAEVHIEKVAGGTAHYSWMAIGY